MFQTYLFFKRAFLFLPFLIIVYLFISVKITEAQFQTQTIRPVRADERYGCVFTRTNPQTHIVHGNNSQSILAEFNGGIPVGKDGRACYDMYGYATARLSSESYRLSNVITITLPAPRKFFNIFIEGRRGSILEVRLNNGFSKQVTLERDDPSTPSGYGKASIFDYDFQPSETEQVSSISVSSPEVFWKFAISSVSFYAAETGGNPPDPPGNPQNPVVFVPGIAGSSLSLADTGEKRWLPGLSSPCVLYDLTLQDITTPFCGSYTPRNIRVDDVMRSEYLGFLDVYGTFLTRIKQQGGYREYDFDNNPLNRTLIGCRQRRNAYPPELPYPTLFVFAYDWRRSNFENVNALKQYVECARLFHPGKNVTIVAHSMGGLLSRNYILQNSDNHHIDKLITIGSPFLGTPKGFNVLQTGAFLDGTGDYFVAGILRNLLGFFPGGHELLPSESYFNGIAPDTPLSILYPWTDVQDLTYSSAKEWIHNRHPISLPAMRGEIFHNYRNSQQQSQDVWQNDLTGVRYFHIYGKRNFETTIGKLIITERTICIPLQIQCNSFTLYTPVPTFGDNTVTLESAKRIFSGGRDYNYKVQSNNEPFRFFEQPILNAESEDLADHTKMLSAGTRVSNRIIKILQPDTQFDESQMSKPDCGNSTEVLDCNSMSNKNSLGGDQPSTHYVLMHNTGNFQVTGISWSLNGEKNIIGFPSANGVEKVPTSEKSAWLAMPGEGLAQRIDFRTNGEPIEIEIIRGKDYDNIEKLIIFKDLLLQPNKKAQLFVIPGGYVLFNYFVNGDDESPIEIAPTLVVEGEMARDINPPVVSYNYQNTANGKVVSLSATDNLAGVRQIRYSLDGESFSRYSAPIQLGFAQTKIYAFAEDNNLNRTGIAEFDINGESYSIGNRVWFDTNNDGKINFDGGFGEEGIGGVSLSLFADNNSDGQPDELNSPLASTITDISGYYRFDNLPSGSYLVRVNPENFGDNGVLKGYRNTTGSSSTNEDSDDTSSGENGIEPSGQPNSVQSVGILSHTVTINTGVNEPTGETDIAFSDNSKVDGLLNATVDFGFYQNTIGGTIWNDVGDGNDRNNGRLDAGETGRSNIRVRLFYGNGQELPVGSDGILGTSDDAISEINNPHSTGVMTDSSGNYLLKGLPSGHYFIKVYRNGFISSTTFSNNPNDNIDSDNNGITGNGTNTDFILSAIFNVSAGEYGLLGNTAIENTDGSTKDLTIDFGLLFSPTAASAAINGKVVSQNGVGIKGAKILITKSNGQAIQAITNDFGYYSFTELETGETYIISIDHRKYSFSPNSRVITLTTNVTDLDFISLP